MTLTLTNPETPKAAKEKAAPKPKPAADAATLRRLAARIEEMKADRFGELVEELAAEGLVLKGKGLFCEAKLAGVTATATAGKRVALDNWTMAARRRILELEG